MGLGEFAIRRATSLWLVIFLLLLGGLISYNQLSRFEDPEFSIRVALLNTPYPGATTQEVADEVTDLIEEAVQALPELKEVRSVSRQGASEVRVELHFSSARTRAQMEQTWDKLRRKVTDAERRLPPGAGPITVNDDFGDVYGLYFAVTGPGYTERQLRDYVEMLQRELALVPGVAKAAIIGQRDEAIYVDVSAEQLAREGYSLDTLYRVLDNQNTVAVAGSVTAGDLRIPVMPAPGVDSFEALKNLSIGTDDEGTVLHLSDIATVTRDYIEPPGMLMRYNGQRAIGLGVANMSGGNVVAMGEAVMARLAELEDQRPVGMEIHPISLQSESVDAAVKRFISNLLAAIAIVYLVLLVFLGRRPSIIIGFVLALTVAGTLLAMQLSGIAMQRISLGALIIALGMLVDNAIVVTDSILVRLEKGEERRQAINSAVRDTTWPLFGGTVVGILAFSAIGLSPSEMGEYAGSLFWVILYSMTLSWLLALTVVPMLAYYWLKPVRKKGQRSTLLERYQRLLNAAMARRGLTIGLLLAILAVAMAASSLIPQGFMPTGDRPQFMIDINLPQGSDIRRTERVLAEIEEIVREHEGVTHITSYAGAGGLRYMLTYQPESPNPAYGQLLVDVSDQELITPMVRKLQSRLEQQYVDSSVKVWEMVFGPGGGKMVEAAFRGPDAAVLRRLAEEAKGLMRQDPTLIAIQDDWREQAPVLRPRYQGDIAQQLGLTIQEINAALEQTLDGRQAGVFRERNELIPILVRAPEEERNHERAIENTAVYSATTGQFIKLSQLIDHIDMVWDDAMIRRIDRQPTIMAQADPAPGLLASEALASIRPAIEALELPPGYRLEWHGEQKASREANEGLVKSAPFGFAAMVLAVVFMFNAIRQPVVIWLTAPLTVVGVVIGLLVFQTPFEFMAILGLLSLIGMQVKNAIILVDQADVDRRAGASVHEAVMSAALSRARPVILSALTTILGMAPLLIDPFFKSMSAAIMFGLLFATALTLVVIPVLYSLIMPSRATETATETARGPAA